MRLQERALVLGFRFAWATFGYVPQKVLYFFADLTAQRTISKAGRGVLRLQFNIARVLGRETTDTKVLEVSKLAMRSYMRYWVDMFALSKRNSDYINSSVEMRNFAEIERALSAKIGVVVCVTHSGNWDLAGAYIAQRFGGITTVAERLRPVQLFDEFTKRRKSRNIEILPHRGGDVPPSVRLSEALRNGKLIGLVTDRDMSRHGLEVDFFGHKSKMPTGATRLAIENSALLIPAAVFTENEKTVIEFYPSVDLQDSDVESATQRMANVFEVMISKHPENWHMLQKIWSDMPQELEDQK
jgi:KDO2-lipid IV(A) lauroyltransferase